MRFRYEDITFTPVSKIIFESPSNVYNAHSTQYAMHEQQQEMERSICQTSADIEIQHEIRLQIFLMLFFSKLSKHCIRDELNHIAFY